MGNDLSREKKTKLKMPPMGWIKLRFLVKCDCSMTDSENLKIPHRDIYPGLYSELVT